MEFCNIPFIAHLPLKPDLPTLYSASFGDRNYVMVLRLVSCLCSTSQYLIGIQ